MENIKQRFSDFVHSWTVIAMITLFLFAVKPETMPHAEALVVKPQIKAAQLKKETLEKYSNTVYKPSESLTPKELKSLLQAVGFEGQALKVAWAVVMKESNGRPMAYNGNRKTGDSSYGIFQINMLGTLGTDRKEKFNLRSNVLLFDPTVNAEIAYHMTNGGTDWSSWKGITPETRKWMAKFPK